MTYANMDNVPTQTAGVSELLASDWNAYVRDNFDDIKFGHIRVADDAEKSALGNVAVGVMVYQIDNKKLFVNSNASVANWVEIVDLDTVNVPLTLTVALSDESTSLTTGTSKVTLRAPFAMTLTQIPRAYVSTASSSGLVTVDINEAGTSILGTNKLSIDANEKTSTTAATATTLADTAIADDAELTFDIDAAGTGAKGLKVTLYFVKG